MQQMQRGAAPLTQAGGPGQCNFGRLTEISGHEYLFGQNRHGELPWRMSGAISRARRRIRTAGTWSAAVTNIANKPMSHTISTTPAVRFTISTTPRIHHQRAGH